MSDNKAFHRPVDIGYFDLAVTQVNETMTLTTVNGTFINEIKAVFLLGGNIVHTYSNNSGIVLSEANKKAVITFNGSDFSGYIDQILDVQTSYFKVGEVTNTFKLKIVKTNV